MIPSQRLQFNEAKESPRGSPASRSLTPREAVFFPSNFSDSPRSKSSKAPTLAQRVLIARQLGSINETPQSSIPHAYSPRNDAARHSSPHHFASGDEITLALPSHRAQSTPHAHHQHLNSLSDILSQPCIIDPLELMTPEHEKTRKQLKEAIAEGDSKLIQELVGQLPPKALNHRFEGFSFLEFAAIKGDVNIVSILIAAGALNNFSDKNFKILGCSALYQAAKFGIVSVMKLLLDNGASPTQLCERDGQTFSILPTAVATNNLECVRTLTNYSKNPKVFVNEPDGENYPLTVAFSNSNADIMEFLLSLGAEIPLAFKGENEDQVFLTAARKGFLNINKLLKKRLYGKIPTSTTPEGITSLHWAEAYRHEAVRNFLLENQADPTQRTTKEWSFVGEDQRVVVIPRNLDYQEFAAAFLNEVALDCLANFCQNRPLSSPKQNITFSNYGEAFAHVIDANKQLNHGKTVLHFVASSSLDQDIITELWRAIIQRKGDPYIKDNQEKNAIQIAEEGGEAFQKLHKVIVLDAIKTVKSLPSELANLIFSYHFA